MNRLLINKILCLILLVFACEVATAQEGAPAYPPAKVEVATAKLRQMASVVEVSGTVLSLNDAQIASEVEGILTWLANVGDAVAAGEVIARINPRLLQIDVTRARANVERLEAEHQYRERQLKRAKELSVANNVSANLLDETEAQRDQALHMLTDAKAQLERAQGDLNRSNLRAPFAGHITERLASVGEFIGTGEDVIRLVDTQRIEIAMAAPINLTQYINAGATVLVSNGQASRGHEVRAVVPVGDAVSRMVEIRLSAAAGDWLVGTPVRVKLPNDEPVATVAVPRDALIERNGQSFVYVVKDDNTAAQVVARIQSIDGLWVGIAEGVSDGDRVVIRGGERLGPGQAVDVIASESAMN